MYPLPGALPQLVPNVGGLQMFDGRAISTFLNSYEALALTYGFDERRQVDAFVVYCQEDLREKIIELKEAVIAEENAFDYATQSSHRSWSGFK